jgi:hypothetical protein
MGSLTVSVGPITGQVSFDNVKGASVIEKYILAYRNSLAVNPQDPESTAMTAQEKIDWFINHLSSHVKEAALGQQRREAEQAAREAAEAAQPQWN